MDKDKSELEKELVTGKSVRPNQMICGQDRKRKELVTNKSVPPNQMIHGQDKKRK
jgi:hypothetical protein